jgi:hypothetical protein
VQRAIWHDDQRSKVTTSMCSLFGLIGVILFPKTS